MGQNILIVESPNKTKKLTALLKDFPGQWTVLATAGHICDLPNDRFGIDLETARLEYEMKPRAKRPGGQGFFKGGKDRIADIKAKMTSGCMVYLATDPDREGEAIAWHVKRLLRLKDNEYHRVTFDAIDKPTLQKALNSPRKIDDALVRAQEARRALDRIVGYLASPLIRNKLQAPVSAGRVQTPALRFVVEREREIRGFKEVKHFGAEIDLGGWKAEWLTKNHIVDPEVPYILDRALAEEAARSGVQVVVKSDSTVEKNEGPPSPLSTSLLMQAAASRFRMDADRVAKAAQGLFEKGLISYHRTDSLNFSAESIAKIMTELKKRDVDCAPGPRKFKSKAGAQEAHEAIHPLDYSITADHVDGSDDEKRLYGLIWERAMISQAADARFRVRTVRLTRDRFDYQASHRTPIFQGWRALLGGQTEDDEDAEEGSESSGPIPDLRQGASVTVQSGRVLEKATKPKPRYTEGTLVKKLEQSGVGRPSTYASIVSVILRRKYIRKDSKGRLHTEGLGERLMDAFDATGFSFSRAEYTANMETDLDEVSEGKKPYDQVVKGGFTDLENEARQSGEDNLRRFAVKQEKKKLERDADAPQCPKCEQGWLVRKATKAGGHFWGCVMWPKTKCKGSMQDEDGKPVPNKWD